MKVLAIIGSPRGKGQGYQIIKRVETHMKKLGEVEFEYLLLAEANLKLCRGCFVCVTRGERLCPLNDDMPEITEKIADARGVILISPGYVYNVSWLMKNFIDRFAYTNHRPRFFDQKLLLIANAGSGMDKTLEALRRVFGIGPEIVYDLEYLSPPWPLSRKARNKQGRQLEQAAEAFFVAMEAGEREVPDLEKYLRFRFFKKVAPTVRDYLPADYEYYRDKQDYYYETEISLLKKIAAPLMLKLGEFFIKDLKPGRESAEDL